MGTSARAPSRALPARRIGFVCLVMLALASVVACTSAERPLSVIVIEPAIYEIESPPVGSTVRLSGMPGYSEWSETDGGGTFTLLLVEELDGVVVGHEFIIEYRGPKPEALADRWPLNKRLDVVANVEAAGLVLDTVRESVWDEVTPDPLPDWRSDWLSTATVLVDSDLLSQRMGDYGVPDLEGGAWLRIGSQDRSGTVTGSIRGPLRGSPERLPVRLHVPQTFGTIACNHVLGMVLVEGTTVFTDSAGARMDLSPAEWQTVYEGEDLRVRFHCEASILVADEVTLIAQE